jgi:hypothetical protein
VAAQSRGLSARLFVYEGASFKTLFGRQTANDHPANDHDEPLGLTVSAAALKPLAENLQ